MSTSQLFSLRHKLTSISFQEFKRIYEPVASQIDKITLENLAIEVYQNTKFSANWTDYIGFFSKIHPPILHTKIVQGKRLIQATISQGKLRQFRQLVSIMISNKSFLQKYTLSSFIRLALLKENIQQIMPLIGQIITIRKYLYNNGQSYQGDKEDWYLVKFALEREHLPAAYELLDKKIGKLGQECEELFQLAKMKFSKKDSELLYKFIGLYLEVTKCNPRKINVQGFVFYQRPNLKDYADKIQGIISDYQQKYPPRKQQNNRRSDNKVKSSMGPREHQKQYSNQPVSQNSKEKLMINIQSAQDQLSVQKQANKIYQNHIQQKQKYFRYQKIQNKQTKETNRIGIMKSQQLRYYLEQQIQLQVSKIKDDNNRFKQCFVEVLNKIREKLTNTLNIQLEVFGSFQTSLCLLESDIDIVAVPNNNYDSSDKLNFLDDIKNILETMKEEIDEVNYINTASVPIIKVVCTSKYGHKKIDITKKTQDHNGLQSVRLIKNYLNLYPPLQSLTFVLKKFIYQSGLSAPYKGGISSYALILMIVAYIQNQYKLYEMKSMKGEILTADLLIGFLKFYGYKMNYVMKSINLYNIHNPIEWKSYGGCLSPYTDPKILTIDLQPKLVIIDPLNQTNNVGRSTHKIKQIQMAFQIAYIVIHTYKQCGKKRRCESYKRISKTKVDDIKYCDNVRPCCILKRMFSCTKKFIKE